MNYYKKSIITYLKFLKFLKPFWKSGLFAGILMIISALLQIPPPILTRRLIDTILPEKNLAKLNVFILILVCIILLKQAISTWQSAILINYRNKVDMNIRTILFDKILRIKDSYSELQRVGYLESRIDDDVAAVGTLFMDTFLNLLINILTFIVGVVLCFYLNKKLAVAALASLPVFLLCYHYFSKRIYEQVKIRQEKWAVLKGATVEFISQAKIIKVFNKTKEILGIFSQNLKDAISSSRKAQFLNLISSVAIGMTAVLLPFYVLWYGIREIIMGRFTLGGFIAFNACIGYLYDPIRSFINVNIDIHAALAAAERIFNILEYEEEHINFGTRILSNIDNIEYRDVSFHYPTGDGRGIDNISFIINKGDKYAIIGETGKGKSTITRLILGLDVPHRGHILINGTEYTTYDLKSIRSRIGYVPQEPELISGTILDNIVLFSNDADTELLKYCIKCSALERAIKRFPKGLSTDIYETGVGISGGEKQRIAIARALLNRPDIIILDEATSAIDPKTEEQLINNLFDIYWRPGLIVISHRYKHLHKFNHILNLNNRACPKVT